MKRILFITLFALSITAAAINPEREYKFTPDMKGLIYTEYQIKTPDNYTINVWEYGLPDSVKTNRTIILVGTDAGNMGYLIGQSKVLLEKGIRVVSFDYRGFGKSSDFKINRDFLFYTEFGLDLDSVVKATREKYPHDKVGLFALSMGTYISLLAKEKIDFLIAEGFYHNPQKVVARIKLNKDKTVLLPESSTIGKLKDKTPALIFCASKDKTTTTEDAREFSADNNVTIIEFEGEHLSGLRTLSEFEFGDKYLEKVMDFLKKIGS